MNHLPPSIIADRPARAPEPAPGAERAPLTRAQAGALLARHADHPSAFLALNHGTAHFAVPGLEGFIAYRPHGRFLFQLGGGFARGDARRLLLERFRLFARGQQKRICAVQLQPDDIALYRQAGFSINQMGSCYAMDLRQFSPAGRHFVKLRNKANQARRAGIEVAELGADLPRTTEMWEQLDVITRSWLRAKGRYTKLIEFMIGELGQSDQAERRVFVAHLGARVIGFISYVPVYGRRPGVLHDITRRVADAPPGVMEWINLNAIARFQREGIAHLHFGLSPFAGLCAEHDGVEGRSRLLSRLATLIAAHGDFIYPSRTQERYKLKWQPHYVAPEYIGFEGGFSLTGLWRLLQLTKTV